MTGGPGAAGVVYPEGSAPGGGAGGGREPGGCDPVVGAAGTPDAHDHTVDDQRVAAELAGVLDRAGQRPSASSDPGVEGEGPGGVDPPQRRAGQPEPPVQNALPVGQHQAGEPEVDSQLSQGVARAEADGDQLDARACELPRHLDQVFLAGQSIAVAEEGEHAHAARPAQVDGLSGVGPREHDPGQGDLDLLLAHGVPASRVDPELPLSVAIIMPVLNEEDRIAATVRRLGRDFPGCPVVVVDGGSTDATARLVAPPALLVRSRPGRGPQLAAGIAHSRAEAFWIHHVDTRVDPEALAQLRDALTDPRVVAGGFTLRFDRRGAGLACLAATSNLRARRLGWIFGDQAMFVRRSALAEVGGVPDLPIMEDLELSRRLARVGRTVLLPAASTASARRFTEHGTVRMVLFMQGMKLRYLTGADPAALARRYAAGPPRRCRRLFRRLRRGAPLSFSPAGPAEPGGRVRR